MRKLVGIICCLVITLFVPGCPNTGTLNKSRSLFPGSEVCEYPENTSLSKFGNLQSVWVKYKESEGYGCQELPSIVYLIHDDPYMNKAWEYRISDPPPNRLYVEYFAFGDTPEGAPYIGIDWQVDNIAEADEHKARSEYFIPFLESLLGKALKTTLPEVGKVKLSTIDFPQTRRNDGSFCERAGEGFFCFSGSRNDSQPFRTRVIRLSIFPNEESFTSNKDK